MFTELLYATIEFSREHYYIAAISLIILGFVLMYWIGPEPDTGLCDGGVVFGGFILAGCVILNGKELHK